MAGKIASCSPFKGSAQIAGRRTSLIVHVWRQRHGRQRGWRRSGWLGMSTSNQTEDREDCDRYHIHYAAWWHGYVMKQASCHHGRREVDIQENRMLQYPHISSNPLRGHSFSRDTRDERHFMLRRRRWKCSAGSV